MKRISELKGHVIICGYGKVGRNAALQLKALKQSYVVIEKEIPEGADEDLLVVQGDATKDEVLLKAGIKNARSLITALPTDPGNLYVVLSARSLNPKLRVISRAMSIEAVGKLKTAGAESVVTPDTVGGMYIASLVVNPDMMTFLDMITVQGSGDASMEEIAVDDLPEQRVFQTIGDLQREGLFGCLIIGYKNNKGEYLINPDKETRLEAHSKLFVIGKPDQIRELHENLSSLK